MGWNAVKKGLDRFFGGFSELKVAQAVGPHVQVWGDVACSTGITTAAARTKAGESLSLRVCDTQVLVKRGGRLAGRQQHCASSSALTGVRNRQPSAAARAKSSILSEAAGDVIGPRISARDPRVRLCGIIPRLEPLSHRFALSRASRSAEIKKARPPS